MAGQHKVNLTLTTDELVLLRTIVRERRGLVHDVLRERSRGNIKAPDEPASDDLRRTWGQLEAIEGQL